ncbi:MAG: 50S ribosomal protein L6 [Bacteroidales bacterium]|nr:50S ribosomal protein L6 [Bacteroidales bacterium]
MSRIGSYPVAIPEGVEVDVSDQNLVTVKGNLGELQQQVEEGFKIEVSEGQVVVTRPSDEKKNRALHGLYRSLINNMITGVSKGYEIVQELHGVGFKATVNGQLLELALGYSHNIYLEMPEEIKAEAVTERGKPPRIILKSIDKQLVGQVAAKIRELRPPEPYKGKGVLYKGEIIRRKAGKAASEK